MTDPLGVTTTNGYDTHGNLTSMSTPLDGTHTRVVTVRHENASHLGDVTSMSDPNHVYVNSSSPQWKYHYDTYGAVDQVTDPAGDLTTVARNNLGWATSVVSPRGNQAGATPADYRTTFDSFNKFGEPTHATDPLGHVVQWGYDPDGRLTSVTDQNSVTTSYGYDGAGELTGIDAPGTADPAYTYWPDGTLNTSSDSSGRTTTYTYDPLGHVATVTDPAGRVTTSTVDAVGNVTSVAHPGGSCAAPITPTSRCVQFGHDAADRVASIAYSDPGTPSVPTIVRDRDGRVLSTTTSDARTQSWVYDNLGRLTSSNDGSGALGYGYDLAGDVTSIAYPGAGTVTRTYDNANRLATVKDWLTHTTTLGRDADGNVATVTYPTATHMVDTYTFDHADQLTAISYAKSGTAYASLGYTLDPTGRVNGITTTGMPAEPGTYHNDSQGRLDTVGANTVGYDAASDPTTIGPVGQAYDASGQICWQAAPSTGGACASAPAGATTFGFDSQGQRTTRTPAAGPAETYTYNQAGQQTAASIPRATTAVAGGSNHTVQLASDGTVWAAGANASGQLGNGTTTASSTLVQTVGLTGVVAVAAGASHTVALRSDGTVWAWGINDDGEPGNGTLVSSSTPIQVPGITGATAIAAGASHSMAVVAGGSVKTWGGNASGQLGNSTTTGSTSPVSVSGLTGVVTVAAGANHSLAVKSDHSVWAWGLNTSGQLGDNTKTNRTAPVQTGTAFQAVSVAAGTNHSLAVKADGSVWAWGVNADGELGTGTTTLQKVPVVVTGLTATAVDGGGLTSVAVKADLTAVAWGANANGQYANNTTTPSLTPTAMGATTATTASSVYAPDGLRASETINGASTTWRWDRSNPLGFLAGQTTTAGTTWQIAGPGGSPLEQIGPTGTISYLHPDQLGSTRIATNPSGNVTASWAYDPFGNPAGGVAPSDVLSGWAGQTADPATGDWSLRARQYDPTTNQFESPDPLGGAAYQYANNDPLNMIDPTGLDAWSNFGNALAGAADIASMGLASKALNAVGVSVNHCSGWYTFGRYAALVGMGIAGGLEFEAPALLESAGLARFAVDSEGVVTDLAAEASEEGGRISFGSKAAAREGLTGDAGTAADRFFRDATAKSLDFQVQELGGGGYRLQFFSPADTPGYGKLYVQEIDSLGNVLKEFKNAIGPDGVIDTKWLHGGP